MAANLPATRRQPLPPIMMEDVRIIFRNFAGAPGQYNAAGDRNFGVIVEDPAMIERLEREGWNLKTLKARDEDEAPARYLKVKVKYTDRSQPRVVLISKGFQNILEESMVEMIDTLAIEKVDLIVRPFQYDVNGNQGISAYCQSIYVTQQVDDLELKYAYLPELGADTPEEIEGEIIYELENSDG